MGDINLTFHSLSSILASVHKIEVVHTVKVFSWGNNEFINAPVVHIVYLFFLLKGSILFTDINVILFITFTSTFCKYEHFQ